jgi:hypothetical protein
LGRWRRILTPRIRKPPRRVPLCVAACKSNGIKDARRARGQVLGNQEWLRTRSMAGESRCAAFVTGLVPLLHIEVARSVFLLNLIESRFRENALESMKGSYSTQGATSRT